MRMGSHPAEIEAPVARLIREQGRLIGWVAKTAGMTRDRLDTVRGGGVPTLTEALRLAEIFGVEIGELLPAAEREGGER